ncbi:IS630 family transposase [Noviherbaspirillum cavernae]|uniref:IS630 family transposase n=1 Tax=Noviherbaspirillum cavernae TaxID=2320862 RepID=A0A418X3W5_9BURK|nr:IS630 family transposase [Noviherbaspirillum cavernae]
MPSVNPPCAGFCIGWACAEKKTVHATERDTARVRLARRRYRKQIASCPVKRLKFIDESGLNIAMTRRYGRAMHGQRVHDAVPGNFGRNVSIPGSLSCHGMEAVMTVEGAVDAAVFRACVAHALVPTLRSGDVVVMDNLSVHKVRDIEAMIAGAGAQLIYLPPYSPDWSPIEPCWSKIKTRLRGMKARTREALDQALTKVIGRISNSDASGWFAHCGYSIH